MNTYITIKRIVDFTLSLAALLAFWPLFVLIAIIIRLDSKGSALLKQKRIGKDKKEFYLLKFRTMVEHAPSDTPTHLLLNPQIYQTRVGKLLRKTSLDEIPQLINILIGDMCIIGPRPALWNQFDLIEERDKYGVNNLTPGLTGWAQINGRDELSIAQKAFLDGYYAQNMGLWLDIKIFLLTIVNVIAAKGINEGSKEG